LIQIKTPPPERSRAPQPTDWVSAAIAKVPGLSAKQRGAVKAAMTTMLRDIGFNKMMADQAKAHALPMDQGRPL
jgi:hypothetical protein